MKKALALALCGLTFAGMLTGCATDADVARLEKKVEKLEADIEELEAENEELMQENSDLRSQISYSNAGSGAGNAAATDTSTELAEDTTADAGTTDQGTPVEVPADPYFESPYQIYTDEYGNVIDLGGMEIIIRDWWSTGEIPEPTNEYEEARLEYREWIQETYNFTIKELAISDWGSTPYDFVDYVTGGGDYNNYVFVIRDDPSIAGALHNGLMYDLSTLDCLDFSKAQYARNLTHEQYTYKGGIYGMYSGFSEARTGVYFNKDVLRAAGVDPDDIYDMQADGTWTWEAFDDIMATVQGGNIYGLCTNESVMTSAAIYSNGGSYVGINRDGYTYNLENSNTVEALEWVVEMYNRYDNHDPDGANWDYYQGEFLSGNVAFYVDDSYVGQSYSFLMDASFDIGFVTFPKGPQVDRYKGCWSNNVAVIPSIYDADRAWKITFAYDLYNREPAGYEDFFDTSSFRSGIFDSRAIDETIPLMVSPGFGTVSYAAMVPGINLGSDFLWNINAGCDLYSCIDWVSYSWQEAIDEANR